MPACQIDPVQLGREQANLRSRSVSRAGGGSLASYTRRRSQPESCLDLILARRLLRGSASIPDSSSQSRNQTLASSGCQWFKDCPSIAWSLDSSLSHKMTVYCCNLSFQAKSMYVRIVIAAFSVPGHTRTLRSVHPATLSRERRLQALQKIMLQLRRSMVPRDPQPAQDLKC
jgi:hypothetical protein